MTVSIFTIIVGVLVMATGLFVFRAIPSIRAYFTFRGKRLITCPETHLPEAVDVDAKDAALGVFLNEPTVRLRQCSRWPERQGCDQDCLQQIEANSEECRVWNIVSKWYEGKPCAYCGKIFGSLHRIDHVPALIGPDLQTTEWKSVRPEQLPAVFASHKPVCWNCHVTESFRRLHPELVTDRPREPRRTM